MQLKKNFKKLTQTPNNKLKWKEFLVADFTSNFFHWNLLNHAINSVPTCKNISKYNSKETFF